MIGRERVPEDEAPGSGDVSIAATMSARRLRYRRKARVETTFPGAGERSSLSSRENLPDQIEEGGSYRDVRVSWRLASSVSAAEVEQELERRSRPRTKGEAPET